MDGLGAWGRLGGGGGGGATLSYYENMPLLFPASTTFSVGISNLRIQPFVLGEAVSASILRVPVSASAISTDVAGTSVNTTFSCDRLYTDFAVVYSQGTGASSLSLQYLTHGSGAWTFRNVFGAAAVGSNYTVSEYITYPAANFGGSTDSSQYAMTSASYRILSTIMATRFTGPRFMDIPFANSLSAGNYWMGFGRSTSYSSNAGPANLSGASLGFSTIGASQSNISWGYPGAATNDSIQVQPGLGGWSTNSAVMSTSSIALANISAVVSNPAMYFQMIRRA